MSPDDERRIEQYCRRPDALSAAERRAVQALIDRDAAARAYADTLDTFYALLDEERGRETAPQVAAFVDELFGGAGAPAVVPVRPFRGDRSAPSTVLAAATTAAESDRRFSVLSTLAAEDEDVLVRVIGDWKAGQGRVYVLADREEQQAHAVVSFPAFGLDLVTDAEGRLTFDLPDDVTPDEWKEATAAVRRPLTTERLPPGSAKALGKSWEAPVRCRRKAGTLTVAMPEGTSGTLPSLMTAEPVGVEAERTLLRLAPNETLRHDLHADDDLRIRLYE